MNEEDNKPEFVTAENLNKKFSDKIPNVIMPQNSKTTISNIQQGMETGTETVDKWNKLADKVLVGLNSGKNLIDYGMKIYEKKKGKTENRENAYSGKTPNINIKSSKGIEKLNQLYKELLSEKVINDKTTLKEVVEKLNKDVNGTAKFIRGFAQNIIELEWK